MLGRRTSLRLGVEAFCTEIIDGQERQALVAGVSRLARRLVRTQGDE
jgi:hypothetical protein